MRARWSRHDGDAAAGLTRSPRPGTLTANSGWWGADIVCGRRNQAEWNAHAHDPSGNSERAEGESHDEADQAGREGAERERAE
jgi:hypothetical protein